MTDNNALINKLIELAKNSGVDPIDLDMAVHDAKGEEAARINNDGLEEQILYIVESYGVVDAERLVKEAAAVAAKGTDGC